MRARLVRPDGTTEAISLPAGTSALNVMYELIGCDTWKWSTSSAPALVLESPCGATRTG